MSLDQSHHPAMSPEEQRGASDLDEESNLRSSPIVANGEETNERIHCDEPNAGERSFAPSTSDVDSLVKNREALLTQEIALREQKVADLERAFRAALRDQELSTALADKPLLPGAAAQLVKLWRDDVEVVENDGDYQVISRDGRNVSQAVEAWLASPEYAHFCQPSSRGGTAQRGTNRPATPSAPRPSPRNLGEAIVLRWQEIAARSPQEPLPFLRMGRRR